MKSKLTLSVSSEKVKEWKIAALEHDMSLSQLVEKAMDEYLRRLKTERKPK